MKLFDKDGLNSLSHTQREFHAYNDFKAIVTNTKVVFPCTLGVAGFAANQLRFHFISSPIETEDAAFELAAALQSFISNARSFGKNTSLVVFFNETRDLGADAYEKIFWKILNKLHRLDARPWPKDIPAAPQERLWEFSFAGEPIFVVCNTPSHRARKSRYSNNFMITFDYGDNTVDCKPGDRLLLPANTPHASRAGKDGCMYVIATRLVTSLTADDELQEMVNA